MNRSSGKIFQFVHHMLGDNEHRWGAEGVHKDVLLPQSTGSMLDELVSWC